MRTVTQIRNEIEALFRELQANEQDITVQITPKITLDLYHDDNRVLVGCENNGWTTLDYNSGLLTVNAFNEDGKRVISQTVETEYKG